MAGRRGFGLEARAVAGATHSSGMGRRMPTTGQGVTAAAAKKRTQSKKVRAQLKSRRNRIGRARSR